MTRTIIIGSRGSDLALWQAHFFQDELDRIGLKSEIKIITTKGDRIQDLSFDKIEGKGFFTKEIEASLMAKEIDVAIHSHKDLETRPVEGLTIAGVSYRDNPTDLLLIHPDAVDNKERLGFKKGAIVGTSSARRKSQIKSLRSDIQIKDIRGNVPTRINKLREGQFDAILLASAGVARLKLDLSDLTSTELDPRVFVPAPAQGVLAYQCREEDEELIGQIRKLHHTDVEKGIEIERKILSHFGGGCQIPIGVHAVPNENGSFVVRASFGQDWEKHPKRVRFNANAAADAINTFESMKQSAGPQNVLITRQLDTDSHFKRGCEAHDIQLTERPFIEIKHLDFVLPAAFDWVFFSSANGVRAVFERISISDLAGKKIAAYGEATARELYKYNASIDFVAPPGQPDFVALSLLKVIGKDRVLFPTSNLSLGSIAGYLAQEQCVHLVVYETIEKLSAAQSSAFDAYVFTSPSNVDGFINSGLKVPSSAKSIAIGASTSDRLSTAGISHSTAAIPHEAELFALLLS